MHQLLITVEDNRMLRALRQTLSAMDGVIVETLRPKKRMSSYERSVEDLKAGRIKGFESSEDLFKDLGL